MKEIIKKIGLLTMIMLVFLTSEVKQIRADEIEELGKQIAAIEASMAPLKTESVGLAQKISTAKNQIANAEKQVITLNQKLVDKEADLEVQKILMSQRVKKFYINSKKFSPLAMFFSSQGTGNILQQYTWYQSVISQDKNAITGFSQDIETLNKNKSDLEAQKVKLASLKKSMENRFGFLSGEIQKAEAYKAELSQKQQNLIAEKTAMFNTSVGDVSSSDDPASRADYNPGFSPAFAAFSFGAPHRKGMSQYGAFGRSKAGQNYETILKAYYGDIRIEKIDLGGSIKTSVGTLPFEENYLVGIAEMPAKWGDEGGYEALKAQAIAARTYALSYTNNLSGTICVDEGCQVYSKSRFNSPGRWKQAVEDTRGMVIKSNPTGKIFSTMYASTSGGATISYSSLGHSTPQVWDTSCGNQGCWPNDSFEKKAGSSWYYKGWYKTRSNASYGRSHPWLNNEEFSDIVNAVLYYSRANDYSHLSQIQNCIGSCDSDAWSKEELRRQVSDKGGPVSNINSISVDYSTAGYTQNIRISTDKGDFTFSGDTFKTIFNLRAPGAIVLKSGLFNIEKK
ncbi:MAG TPA: SpoIID/LytB domain-containing protein [Candidatus Methanoperedens sp.]|nr:SpoIID/LytB domain-containing protein [Candidatus Methanoperedens sp.]